MGWEAKAGRTCRSRRRAMKSWRSATWIEARSRRRPKSFPVRKQFRDFRKMLDEVKEIDAVTISTPDHAHYPAAMHAIALGKHVCMQKPLVNTLWEARELHKAAKKKGVITQMGNQGHTYDDNRVVKEWLDAGAMGKVKEIHVWTNRPIWPQGNRSQVQAGRPCRMISTGISGSRRRPTIPIPPIFIRSNGAASSSGARALSATWAATTWMPRSLAGCRRCRDHRGAGGRVHRHRLAARRKGHLPMEERVQARRREDDLVRRQDREWRAEPAARLPSDVKIEKLADERLSHRRHRRRHL